MQSKLLIDGPERVFAVIFQTGDEPVSGLKQFAADQQLKAASISGIGAFQNLTVGYFDWQTKQYKKIPIQEQVEVISMIGDISLDEDGQTPKLHIHLAVAKSDGTAHGGHLMEARVRPTLEVIVTESPSYLRRKHDPESGIALIDLGA